MAALELGIGLTGDHNVVAAWQGPSDGGVRFASHQNAMVHGDPFEMPQVFWNMPRHFTPHPDDPVLVAGHHQAQGAQTDTSALICGWGS